MVVLTVWSIRGRRHSAKLPHNCYPQCMGPIVTAKTYPKPAARPLPADVADVALIAADTCAAIGDVSVSWWHEEVRTDRAPKPATPLPGSTGRTKMTQQWLRRSQ